MKKARMKKDAVGGHKWYDNAFIMVSSICVMSFGVISPLLSLARVDGWNGLLVCTLKAMKREVTEESL